MKKFTSIILTFLIMGGFFNEAAFAAKKPVTSLKHAVKTNENVFSYVNMDWWKEFNDSYLTEYVIKAVNNNHKLKTATLKVEETTEQKNIVRANEMPMLGIGAVPSLYKLPGATNSEGIISLPALASYEVDLWGKNRDKTKSMDKTVEISKENERATYISVVSAVGTTYYNIVKLDKMILLQEEIIKDREKIYKITKLSNDEGLASTADTVSANKSYLKAQTDMTELLKMRERLLNLLCVLTGESSENSDDIKRAAFDELVMSKKIPDMISSDVIYSRPDYISAEKTLEKTGLDIRAAKKEFLPTINIFGLLSFNSTKYFSKLNWTNALATLGGGVVLPLFDGGKRIANLKLKKNKYEQAWENWQDTNLTAVQEVNDALCDLKLDNEKIFKTEEQYESEKKNYHYSDLKYKEGVISALDLLQKKEVLLSTEKQLVSDKTLYFTDMIGLYKATGAKVN